LTRTESIARFAGARYLGGLRSRILPLPQFKIPNGGKHAADSCDFQEFMVAPVGASTNAEALRIQSPSAMRLAGRLVRRSA